MIGIQLNLLEKATATNHGECRALVMPPSHRAGLPEHRRRLSKRRMVHQGEMQSKVQVCPSPPPAQPPLVLPGLTGNAWALAYKAEGRQGPTEAKSHSRGPDTETELLKGHSSNKSMETQPGTSCKPRTSPGQSRLLASAGSPLQADCPGQSKCLPTCLLPQASASVSGPENPSLQG